MMGAMETRPQDECAELAPERAIAAIRQIREAWAHLAEQLIPVMQRFAQALQPLAEMANSPEGRALIALHEAGLLPARTEHCHCLCGVAHPGVHPCWGPVPLDRLQRVPILSATFGEVQVSMCPACAALAAGEAAAAL
jgi:hypothetical protein